MTEVGGTAAGADEQADAGSPPPIARIEGVSTWRIWGDGQHNAFPGIARFGEHYYVTFRRASQHQEEDDSRIVVIRSGATDLNRWEEVAVFRRDHDSRDPLLVALDGRLQLVWHSKEDWFSQSVDGTSWTEPQLLDSEFPEPPPGSKVQFTSKRRWLFRIRRGPDGAYYSLARCGIKEKDSPGPFGLILYRSEDGVKFKALHTFGEGPMKAMEKVKAGGWGHEADVAWWPDGTLVAAIRLREGVVAYSSPPYREWTAYKTGVFNFGGPALHATRQGGMLLAARSSPEDGIGQSKMMVWSVGRNRLLNRVELPSSGDCAYSSFAAAPAGGVLLCYYSGHERIEKPGGSRRPANIYLAQLAVTHQAASGSNRPEREG